MHRSTALALLASAALTLALAGCSMEKVERSSGVVPTANAAAIAEPGAGHELHTMFEAEKRNAVFSELPAQF